MPLSVYGIVGVNGETSLVNLCSVVVGIRPSVDKSSMVESVSASGLKDVTT